MKNSRSGRLLDPPAGVEVDMVRALDRAPAVHRLDAEVDRVIALVGRGPKHPVLVGPSEAGKTALAWAIAWKIANGARPGGARAMWHVSLRTLDVQYGKEGGAGARLAEILNLASLSPLRPIVYVSDLRVLRAFEAEHGLVTALRRGGVNFLGEALPPFLAWCTEDAELASVTHVVRVDEATTSRTMDLLRAHAALLEKRDHIAVDDAALARIVRYADRLMPHRRFPGKALSLLDEAAREVTALPERRVTTARVTDRVCEALRVPRFLIDPDTAFDADAIRAHLRSKVVGQDDAIDAIVETLALYKADVSDARRPLGVLLLAGPPGVGKTLLAEQIAEYVFGSANRLARISLAEHSEDWKADQLFGVRTSQSSDARRGLIARQLAGKPFSVLLLDEMDKAHPLACKHLLRPLDEGRFVNANDDEVWLRNTLVVLTTSAGGDAFREASLGFSGTPRMSAHIESARKRLADMLPADLLDRVDRVCICPPLGGDRLGELARREVDAALARAGLLARGVHVDIDAAVFARLGAETGYVAGASGARALRRAVERTIMVPLALHLLANGSAPGTRVEVRVDRDAIVPVTLSREPDPEPRIVGGEVRIERGAEPAATPEPPRTERAAARRRARVTAE